MIKILLGAWMVVFSSMVNALPTAAVCTELTWSAVTTDLEGGIITVDKYRVYQAGADGVYSLIGDTMFTVHPFPAMPDGLYSYMVTAVVSGADGALDKESGYSNVITTAVVVGAVNNIGIPSVPGALNLKCSITVNLTN